MNKMNSNNTDHPETTEVLAEQAEGNKKFNNK